VRRQKTTSSLFFFVARRRKPSRRACVTSARRRPGTSRRPSRRTGRVAFGTEFHLKSVTHERGCPWDEMTCVTAVWTRGASWGLVSARNKERYIRRWALRVRRNAVVRGRSTHLSRGVRSGGRRPTHVTVYKNDVRLFLSGRSDRCGVDTALHSIVHMRVKTRRKKDTWSAWCTLTNTDVPGTRRRVRSRR